MGELGRVEGPVYVTGKRIMDVIVSTSLLIMLSPVLAALAIAIKLEDGGTILFRCDRVGRGGRGFKMLKFRKMHEDASGSPLTLRSDPRLTRVGSFLARSKLDEVLQLWNVVKGDMSLVGPRPEDRMFVEMLPDHYSTILRVRPGITGLSQLAFAREGEILDPTDRITDYVSRVLPQKAALDEFYAHRFSLRMDARILAWTVMVVVFRRDVAVHRKSGRLNARRRPCQRSSGTASSPLEGET